MVNTTNIMGNHIMSRLGTASGSTFYDSLDKRDQEIISLLLGGLSNKAIATRLEIPMSTVQRRTRRLFEKEIVLMSYQLNHKKLGLRKGLMHVYLTDGNMQAIAQKLALIPGIQSISIHIGNSDIVAEFIFKETQELLNIISESKKLGGVDKVMWSEEVLNFDARPEADN